MEYSIGEYDDDHDDDTMIDWEDDFGFTTMSEEEVVKPEKDETGLALARVYFMYNVIEPLIDNLMKNPENEIIKWPDRAKKLKAFKKKLQKIRDGELTIEDVK